MNGWRWRRFARSNSSDRHSAQGVRSGAGGRRGGLRGACLDPERGVLEAAWPARPGQCAGAPKAASPIRTATKDCSAASLPQTVISTAGVVAHRARQAQARCDAVHERPEADALHLPGHGDAQRLPGRLGMRLRDDAHAATSASRTPDAHQMRQAPRRTPCTGRSAVAACTRGRRATALIGRDAPEHDARAVAARRHLAGALSLLPVAIDGEAAAGVGPGQRRLQREARAGDRADAAPRRVDDVHRLAEHRAGAGLPPGGRARVAVVEERPARDHLAGHRVQRGEQAVGREAGDGGGQAVAARERTPSSAPSRWRHGGRDQRVERRRVAAEQHRHRRARSAGPEIRIDRLSGSPAPPAPRPAPSWFRSRRRRTRPRAGWAARSAPPAAATRPGARRRRARRPRGERGSPSALHGTRSMSPKASSSPPVEREADRGVHVLLGQMQTGQPDQGSVRCSAAAAGAARPSRSSARARRRRSSRRRAAAAATR